MASNQDSANMTLPIQQSETPSSQTAINASHTKCNPASTDDRAHSSHVASNPKSQSSATIPPPTESLPSSHQTLSQRVKNLEAILEDKRARREHLSREIQRLSAFLYPGFHDSRDEDRLEQMRKDLHTLLAYMENLEKAINRFKEQLGEIENSIERLETGIDPEK